MKLKSLLPSFLGATVGGLTALFTTRKNSTNNETDQKVTQRDIDSLVASEQLDEIKRETIQSIHDRHQETSVTIKDSLNRIHENTENKHNDASFTNLKDKLNNLSK